MCLSSINFDMVQYVISILDFGRCPRCDWLFPTPIASILVPRQNLNLGNLALRKDAQLLTTRITKQVILWHTDELGGYYSTVEILTFSPAAMTGGFVASWLRGFVAKRLPKQCLKMESCQKRYIGQLPAAVR